jgi:hypothetical protein
LDEKSKPFLRVGPGGVQASQHGGSWTKLGTTPAWAWLERRAASPHRAWSIGAKLGGRSLTIFGRVEWRPISAHHEASSQGPRIALVLVAASAPLVLGALILAARHGSRREAG